MGQYLPQGGGAAAGGGQAVRPGSGYTPHTNPQTGQVVGWNVPQPNGLEGWASGLPPSMVHPGLKNDVPPYVPAPPTAEDLAAVRRPSNRVAGNAPGTLPFAPSGGGHRRPGSNAPSIDPAAPAGSNWGQPSWWPVRVQDSFDPWGGSAARPAAPQRQRGPAGKA